jgi:hypothetical protein
MKISKVVIKKTKKNDIKKSGYYAVFGDENIAELFRKVQSTTIRNGNELQSLILDSIKVDKDRKDYKLEDITNMVKEKKSFYIANYKISKEELLKRGVVLLGKEKIDVDAIFAKDGILYIIEYKQGDNFDTKKSHGEIESLNKLYNFFKVDDIEVLPKFVLWVSDDIENSSVKTTENKEFLTTGKEISDILGISFDEIEAKRKSEHSDNISYILSEFEKIKVKYEKRDC